MGEDDRPENTVAKIKICNCLVDVFLVQHENYGERGKRSALTFVIYAIFVICDICHIL